MIPRSRGQGRLAAGGEDADGESERPEEIFQRAGQRLGIRSRLDPLHAGDREGVPVGEKEGEEKGPQSTTSNPFSNTSSFPAANPFRVGSTGTVGWMPTP